MKYLDKNNLPRRKFLGGTMLTATAGLLHSSSAGLRGSDNPKFEKMSTFLDLIRVPDSVAVFDGPRSFPLQRSGARWAANGIFLNSEPVSGSGQKRLPITLMAKNELSRIHIRWKLPVAEGIRFLGDTWERSYGDLEWRSMVAERAMPWYFLANDGNRTHCYGVETRPNVMAFWRVDRSGVSLWLDARNGASPVQLNGRMLSACTVVTREGREGESAWQAGRAFCLLMSPDPRLSKEPIYGGNNWYYAYGDNCTAEAIIRDAGVIADLVGGVENRPFEVVDDGWQIAGGQCCTGGPWSVGNAGFPDMPGLAAKLKSMGVRPGIWVRPLLSHERGTERWALNRPSVPAIKTQRVIDPTLSEVKARIREDMARFVAWGYELIKHDYTTWDFFNRWGRAMEGTLTDDGWSFYDRTRTTAEIILDVYKMIREGAGHNTVIIGCNTIGHLAAGFFELQRTGDDTSGLTWERTRHRGVNCLAMRSIQHGTFFSADADCVGLTKNVPWAFNKQWLDLLARSGTPLFVSASPDAIGPDQRKALKEAFKLASKPLPTGEPLDWMDTTAPSRWRFGKETVSYDWYGEAGIETFGTPR